MSLRISHENSAMLLEEYLKLVNQETGRARSISMMEEANPALMTEHDAAEATGIAQFYLSGMQLACKSLKNGDLEKFDAITGDHNCHVSAVVATLAFQDEQMHREAAALLDSVQAKKKKICIRPRAPTPPHELLEKVGCSITISQRMKYLVIAAILRSGTECTEHLDGTMTLKISPTNIQMRHAKCCPRELVERLIVPFREYLNRQSVATVQSLARSHLPHLEALCLSDSYVKVDTTVRKERFQYPCAFLNMKVALHALARSGVHFAVVKYHRERVLDHPPLLFAPDQQLNMQLVNRETLVSSTPVFVMQAFFNTQLAVNEIGKRLEQYGLVRFILAAASYKSQFVDMKADAYARDEDLQELPVERQEEIKHFRKEAQALCIATAAPEICRIVHTYADILQNIKQNVK